MGVFDGTEDGGHSGGDVFAVFQRLQAMAHVTGRIGGDEDGFNPVVLHQFLERRIGFRTATGLSQTSATMGNQIADGYDFDIWRILKTERGAELANAKTDDSYAELAIRNWFPA